MLIAWRRRDRIELALAGVVVAWVALVAVMTQSGFSGNARYLLPATVVACLLTGTALGHLLRSGRRSVPAAVAAVALAALAVSAATERVPALERQARTAQRTAELDRDLGVAVARMGGARRGRRRRRARRGPRVHPADGVADHVADRPGRAPLAQPGLVFAAGRRNPVTLVAQTTPAPALSGRLVVGRWRVYERRVSRSR